MRRAATLLCLGLLAGGGTPAAALESEAEVLELFAGLPRRFVVERVEEGERASVFRLRSAEPIRRGAGGSVYSRATVTVTRLADRMAAAAELERMLAAADPDTGLSYAWDFAVAAGGAVVHLHAGCTMARESFVRVARALAREAAGGGAEAQETLWCRCGGGCRPGAPFGSAPRRPDRLPPVRRDAEVEEDEYDNRLDPSGAWRSEIGELSLVHYANRLAFTYAAVFGPTAHICEGAGVAGLVGTDRYEHVDEQGTVAFVVSETALRLEVVDGIASFCGAGWTGDSFALDGFASPDRCTVAAERTHFHVVDLLDPEITRDQLPRGADVEVVPAQGLEGEEWVLARFRGPRGSRLGLLPRRDLECRGAAGS